MTIPPITDHCGLAAHLLAIANTIYVALLESDDDAVEHWMRWYREWCEVSGLGHLLEEAREGFLATRAERN